MQYSEELLAKWEHIVQEVNKTEVPVECIKKVIIKLAGKRQKTINLSLLRRQGLDSNDIETLLTRTLAGFGDMVRDIDFVLDVAVVAELIQPQTDELLNGL